MWFVDVGAGEGRRLRKFARRGLSGQLAAERRENAAHCASRGVGRQKKKAPKGRKKMSHTSGNNLLHFIFSTRQRRPLIKPEFQSELFAYLGGIIREMDGAALVIKGTSNH